jgi:hypothetical protein
VRANVFIIHRKLGKIVERREGHNVVVDLGRTWIRDLLYLSLETRRVKYIGLGIGGNEQVPLLVAPFNVIYPVGANVPPTTGFDYKDVCPIVPVIETLERPVRVAGGVAPYPVAPPGDQWRMGPSGTLFITHPTLYSVGYSATFDGTLGHLVYPPMPTPMPISEAALFLDDAPVLGTPYSQVVAYHNFPPVLIDTLSKLEISWHLRF